MRVWVSHDGDTVPSVYASHLEAAEDAQARRETLVELPVLGAEGKVLVDRGELRQALEDSGRCRWYDCRRFAPVRMDAGGRVELRPHSGTCPLRDGDV